MDTLFTCMKFNLDCAACCSKGPCRSSYHLYLFSGPIGSEKSNKAELLAVPTAKGIVDLKGLLLGHVVVDGDYPTLVMLAVSKAL